MKMHTLTFCLFTITFLLTSCLYKVPITSKPTSNIDQRLIGDWLGKDQKEVMKIRMFNEKEYIVSLNGSLSRAFHSDVEGTRFINIQDLDGSERIYAFASYGLSEDLKQLTVKIVSQEMVPSKTPSSEEVQTLLKRHLKNPALYNVDVGVYTKK